VKHTNNQPENTMSEEQINEKPVRIISGFWRRLFAFIIDGIILGIFGLIIGTIYFDYFAELGGWGRLFGFVIALIYFGLLNSSLSNGQTIGKRFLKIKVVDKDVTPISPIRASIRFLILGTPYFLNGALIQPDILMNPFVALLIGLVVFFVGGGIIYLYIFNRNTRQSLHDLAVGTYVIRSSHAQAFSFSPLWKGHLAVLSLIFITVVALITTVIPKLSHKALFSELFAVQQSIQRSGLVHSATVTAGKSFGTNLTTRWKGKRATSYFSINAVLKKRPTDYDEAINNIASIILDGYPQIMEKGALVINVTYGYDIGISKVWKSQGRLHSPEEWKALLSRSYGKTKI
jgi:uncharacterized RDD family membrane protein YckC